MSDKRWTVSSGKKETMISVSRIKNGPYENEIIPFRARYGRFSQGGYSRAKDGR